MAIHVVSYDLNRAGQNYPALYEGIKALGPWCHPVDSTWLVSSAESAAGIRDRLVKHVDSNDVVLVHTAAKGLWAGWNLSKPIVEWLNQFD